MKTLALIIAILSVFSSTAQKVETDVTKANLIGRVKTVEEYYNVATEKEGEIQKKSISEKFTYDVKGNRTEWIMYRYYYIKETYGYDDKGNMTEKKKFKEDGSLNYRIVYRYDEKGKGTGENQYKADGSLEYRSIYKYDDKGRKTEKNRYNPDGSSSTYNRYKYDEKGNMTEDISYFFNGDLCVKNTFKYGDKGNMIEWESYSKILEDNSTKNYDDKGNMIALIWSNGSISVDTCIIEYDDKRNKIKNSQGKTIFTYIYEYDKTGNWIKRKDFEDDQIGAINERKIEYFD